MTRLLGISGSLRRQSFNTMLVHEAARLFDPETFEFADIRFPLYDGDLEDAEGIPPEVQKVADQIAVADAVIISCPEYNKNLSGVMKNALDWISRTEGNPWLDKPVAIMSATAGRAGGERSQNSLRLCMQPFRPLILQGPEVLVGGAQNHFDDDRRLSTESYVTFLQSLMDDLKTRT
ncbi:NAD(P)H-dependent oxidoreductase [Ponticoccus sp. SC2-23]|uniref:NADPH-dependent FMN reductase n=1 Tax=Alexandriicola marinus TaxID=2081710 RepID=UPI000FD72907|nr:NAD(P)H-dependent oxidoreductase [Alexandriicola marinus]MBM1221890.1 NAD(P)H-dependent oxidoreductase [Ponticoccus sp. SC6-9]MBM1226241.1 NAD(P)H-dependent oxidoreductase [Ponticoccus sp. SC6-15]MBM1230837.1 NAD(P)H-dependent oxidoreductase [Ponticoccus sp. SC6-38]MBM1235322.1 NAD(P)H-dependent oxidoreductase [Ponticoccus sp. SC6-45]MBM1239859.1 NAD(P)H-dependent oxidoreductase [Ponticoccus sp. SC6-49]MBM1244003.1 NAD(P)H-dependent oxidoreductase [Ponticoccus sp. SC2-64]MBM1248846.1 NAD(